MTQPQLQTIHIFRQKLEKAAGGAFGRPEYDLLLINIGLVKPNQHGAISSKGLSNVGFERVMAFLEGWLEKFDPKVGRRWRNADDRRRNGLLSRRQEYEIHRLHAALIAADGPRYTIQGLCHRQSQQRTTQLHELSAKEASDVIELLNAAIARQQPRTEAMNP